MSFQVQTEAFDGPFDLLLHLILKDEVDLYDIPLAGIVDAYLAEIERMDACDLEVATEFLLIAATLVELKCRRLLPVDIDIDLDEELGLWEERDTCSAGCWSARPSKTQPRSSNSWPSWPHSSRRVVPVSTSGSSISPPICWSGSPPSISTTPSFEPLRRNRCRRSRCITSPRFGVSVTDAIERLVETFPTMGVDAFRQITRHCIDRVEVVVELPRRARAVQQGLVELEQVAVFGNLTVEWVGGKIGVDDYVLAGADIYEG